MSVHSEKCDVNEERSIHPFIHILPHIGNAASVCLKRVIGMDASRLVEA